MKKSYTNFLVAGVVIGLVALLATRSTREGFYQTTSAQTEIQANWTDGTSGVRTYKTVVDPSFDTDIASFNAVRQTDNDLIKVFPKSFAFRINPPGWITFFNVQTTGTTPTSVTTYTMLSGLFTNTIHTAEVFFTSGELLVFDTKNNVVKLYKDTTAYSTDPSYKKLTVNPEFATNSSYKTADSTNSTVTTFSYSDLPIPSDQSVEGIKDKLLIVFVKEFGDIEVLKQYPVPSTFWNTEEQKTAALNFIATGSAKGVSGLPLWSRIKVSTKGYWNTLISLLVGIFNNKVLFTVVLLLVGIVFFLISLVKFKIAKEEAAPASGGGRKNMRRK